MKLTFKGPEPGDVWPNGVEIAEDAEILYPAPGMPIAVWVGTVQNMAQVLEVNGSEITIEWRLNAAKVAIEKLLDQVEYNPSIIAGDVEELPEGTRLVKRCVFNGIALEERAK